MVEITHDLVGRVLEIAEIYEQTDIVQLAPARVNFYFIIVTVEIFAFSLVAAQLMRAGEIVLNHRIERAFPKIKTLKSEK